MPTATATQPEIHPDPQHQPFFAAAGVGFFHGELIAQANVQGYALLCRFIEFLSSCQKQNEVKQYNGNQNDSQKY